MVSIYFLASDVRAVVVSCSVFTLAHSLSLGLTAGGYYVPDPAWVEPIVAFSIVVTALANIVRIGSGANRLVAIFFFGLIHGMGFARALQEVGLPKGSFLPSLLSFNVGVELGQLVVIFAVYVGLVRWFSEKPWYRSRIVMPASSIMACIALYWTIERIFL